MKRILNFERENEKYIIKENAIELFSIDVQKLEFNSLNFYRGIYQGGKSTQIELNNNIQAGTDSKSGYIFKWLNDIFKRIMEAFDEVVDEAETPCDEERDDAEVEFYEFTIHPPMHSHSKRSIKLFELVTCAGDGNLMDDSNIPFETIDTENPEASFAITISGRSMEPTYLDKSILLIKKTEELNNKDVGIFLVDEAAMCKRYYKYDDGTVVLKPDNVSGEFASIELDSNMKCIIQGKVIGIHEPLTV